MHDLVENNKYVFLSRPRRFGKSLLISPIEAYFLGRKDLFKGLDMERLETDWLEYPVLRFDLSGESYQHPEKLASKLNLSLSRYESVYGRNPEADTLSSRFGHLIQAAERKTGRKVVILIDEYDKPLTDAIEDDPLKENFRKELAGFYGVLKGNDAHIRFAMLTGITRYGHVSVFSGLNNLNDISLDDSYNAICGVSESEFHRYFEPSVKEMALEYGVPEQDVRDAFRVNYDGYHFSKAEEGIYNPFSIMLSFQHKEIGSHWFASGTPSFLVNAVRRYSIPLASLEGESFTKAQLSDVSDPETNYQALFFQAGYLTIKGYVPGKFGVDSYPPKFTLGIPNEEVRRGFWDSLYRGYLFQGRPVTPFDEKGFIHAVETGDPEDFMARLGALLAELSHGNTPKEDVRLKEINFQNDLQIIFRMLGFLVRTEIAVASGRIDMTVETGSYVYIFEFKVDSTAEEALKQVKKNVYDAKFAADPRRVFLIGASFSSRTNTLADCIIE